jgi:soluble lytic murein transglycosylase-like protein
MQKRLLGVLVIGGVVVLCLAPNVRAEDKTTLQWEGSAVSSGDKATPTPVPAPASTEVQRPKAPSTGVDRTAEQYRPLVESISRRNGVDPNLIDAMIRTESNYNPWAVSPKGALGLMQLIPETGRRYGVSNFFDPEQNIEGGVRYMKYLLEMFDGNVDLSLAAYNAGENLVSRIQKIPPYAETRNYVRKIRAAYTKPKAPTPAITSNLKANSTAQPAPVVSPKVAPVASAGPSEKAEEAPPPIARWVDERGVRHFSNIEPLK